MDFLFFVIKTVRFLQSTYSVIIVIIDFDGFLITRKAFKI